MSLKVWLPLVENLLNYGTSGLTFTTLSTNTISANGGKIGPCYSNDNASSGGLRSNTTIVLGQNQSMFCWFKFTSLTSSSSLGAGLVSLHRYNAKTGMGITIRYVSSTTGYLSVNTGTGSDRTYNTYYGTTLLQANTWYHGGYTYDGTNIRIYVNGVCEKTLALSGMSVPADYITAFCWSMNASTGSDVYGGYKLIGSLNDIRVYDHCLSAAEVREISLGLIEHYKLDAGPQAELVNAFNMSSWNTNTAKGGFNTWGSSGHAGTAGVNTDRNYIYYPNRTYSYWVANGANSTPVTYLFYLSPAFDGGYRSLLCIVKEENSTPITEDILRPSWNANVVGDYHAIAAKWTRISSLGNGFYLCQCDGFYLDGSNDLAGLSIVRGYKVYISEIWLEDNKEICTNIFMPVILIKDSSGYNRNATITGTFDFTKITPRYYCAASMSGSTYGLINSTVFASTDLNPEFTWCGWIKRKNEDSTTRYLYYGICSIYTYTDYKIRISWAHATSSSSSGNTWAPGILMPLNDWIHIAFTFKDGALKVYSNGTYISTSDRTSTGLFIKGTYGRILFAGSSYAAPFNGSLSDMRVYTTCLSADDIKSIYNLGARIDNKLNIHSLELREIGAPKITKRGQFLNASFIESTSAKILSTTSRANNFIEI